MLDSFRCLTCVSQNAGAAAVTSDSLLHDGGHDDEHVVNFHFGGSGGDGESGSGSSGDADGKQGETKADAKDGAEDGKDKDKSEGGGSAAKHLLSSIASPFTSLFGKLAGKGGEGKHEHKEPGTELMSLDALLGDDENNWASPVEAPSPDAASSQADEGDNSPAHFKHAVLLLDQRLMERHPNYKTVLDALHAFKVRAVSL